MPSNSRHFRPGQPDFFSREVSNARRYYLDLSPPSNVDLTVVSGGYEECAPNYRVKRKSFPHYAIEWVVRGKGRVFMGGKKHDLSKGCLYCYGPGTSHDIQTDSSRPLAKHFVSFIGTASEALLQRATLTPGTVKHVTPRIDLAWIFESLRRDGEPGDKFALENCKALLQYLLAKLASSPSNPNRDDEGAHATFVRCDQYLVENARDLGSLSAFADDCDIDEAYLCRLYRRFSTETPYQRLRRLKMNLAAEELLNGATAIHQIANGLGFADPFNFSRTFKSVFGIPPSEFRRLH